MRMTQKERNFRFYQTMNLMGFTFPESETLLRAERILNLWSVDQCNGVLQQDETTLQWTRFGRPWRDRQKATLTKVENLAKSKGYLAYHQGDPRGCSLYLVHESEYDPEKDYTDGFAICP